MNLNISNSSKTFFIALVIPIIVMAQIVPTQPQDVLPFGTSCTPMVLAYPAVLIPEEIHGLMVHLSATLLAVEATLIP